MGKILLKNIVSEGAPSNILIDDGVIVKVVSADNEIVVSADAEVVDCTGKVAFPGFVNMHTHAGMAMMRGLGEDVAFHQWISNLWGVEENIDEEYVYYATRLACLEMIKTGTTTFNDQYWYSQAGYRAAMELGLRPVLYYVVCDKGNPAEIERQKRQCEEYFEKAKEWDRDAVFGIAIHAIYSVQEELLLWASEFARKHNLLVHTHISETQKEVEDCMARHGGLSPVEYLDSLGVLGPNVIAAHTLWLSENDIRILAERGVTCVHNINSNLKLSSGYKFLYKELKEAGANVCIGTDGCASSNNLDMLEAMKTAALVQKAWRNDPTVMPLNEVIGMATVNGGRALGLNIGKIEEGALADILIINTDSYHFVSNGTFEANLVYSAHSDCVESVICNGRFVMRDRVVPGEREIVEQARNILKNY